MRRTYWLELSLLTLLAACSSGSEDNGAGPKQGAGGGKADDGDSLAGAVCRQYASMPNPILKEMLRDVPGAIDDYGAPVIANYTAWPSYSLDLGQVDIPADVIAPRTDPNDARTNLASRFGGECSSAVLNHMNTAKPNVYIYFSGFGGAVQNNSLVDEGAILRWINLRDPSALIFSINWNCEASADPFCATNTDALAAKEGDVQVDTMTRAIDVIVPKIANEKVAQEVLMTVMGIPAQQRGYDSAHSHSMQLAAQLIDQLLVADKGADGASILGDIRILGYSMGAHSAAQLLVQDFGSGGYAWSTDACQDGSSTCTVAGLKKVRWSLAMGLSGWSHAIQSDPRSKEERDQYDNGGLFRVSNEAYANKLVVLNRRKDPTGNSDDTFQRGIRDMFLGDYNHYSHDYSLPLFIDTAFIRVLDAYLEGESTTALKEIGAYYDNALKIDFDECTGSDMCDARTGYLAHYENRSHEIIDIPKVSLMSVTDGVEHPDRPINRAARMANGANPIRVRTFDQEDLRGGVELYVRPLYEPSDAGLHGLFSYGVCQTSDQDLMPEAYIENGSLMFSMKYLGETYTASVPVAEAHLAKETWTHLAFTWELPVKSMTPEHSSVAELEAALPAMMPDLEKHKLVLAIATGLRGASPSTYKRQEGQGTLKVYANGNLVTSAPLGTADSKRECLSRSEVLSGQRYNVNGQSYQAFTPYAGYESDEVEMDGQSLGSVCKAYRVRNTDVMFGCARSTYGNAEADMDDIVLIWGPGRTDYQEIDHETGEPTRWPVGSEYGPGRLRL